MASNFFIKELNLDASHFNQNGLRSTLISLACDLRLVALVTALTAAWSTSNSMTDAWPPPVMEIFNNAWAYARAQFIVNGTIVFCVSSGHRALPLSGTARWLGLLGLCVLAVLAGTGTHLLLGQSAFGPSKWLKANYLPFILEMICTQTLLLVGLREFAQRSRTASDALHAGELRQLAIQAEATQARLQVLRAQIEPHFLFNSFANVRCLLRTDAAAASSLLLDLLHYLGEALPRLSDAQTTLSCEVKLTHAFLSVHAVRMGQRLRFDFDVPDALAGCNVPPMSLLTLVENALKHGLQPLAEGGAISISARSLNGMLVLSVTDDGCGIAEACGHGTGLSNLRAQLKAIYGTAASLSLCANEPRGTTASIAFPDLPQ